MRILVSLFLALLAAKASAQTCTGLCLQQVSCPTGQLTTISGVVYAPNGLDPLPNVLVYIPNAPVDAFTPGVSCPAAGAPPSGAPLVGTTTGVDGSFTLSNVPVGTNIPIVVQSGRWRRQVVVPTTTGCADTAFSTRFPRNQSEGDIPKFAVATGSADGVECVLRKVGIDDTEFTDATGTGRVNLFKATASPGAVISGSTPYDTAVLDTQAGINAYDVLMLPCEGGPSAKSPADLANLIGFANAGGRVYASHYSYVWLMNNGPFNGVAKWAPNGPSPFPDPGTATVDTTFAEGQTLATWLVEVGATKTTGQMVLQTLRNDQRGVIAPTQSWLTLNNPGAGNPVMQFVFDTPVGVTANQCGRVLFNEYHVENGGSSGTFPRECSGAAMTPQEKLLEYSLFELTNDGGQATLTPTVADFGNEAVGFTSASQTFTWTNNSTFSATVSLLGTVGDFAVASNNCASVAGGASCTIQVVFQPTALGARTGKLSVGAGAQTLTAALTGTGIPALTLSGGPLDFGSHDVGSSTTLQLTVSNTAGGAVPYPGTLLTGDYSTTSNCPGSVPTGATCTIAVTFKPSTTGTRAGSVALNNSVGLPVPVTGNGVDFTLTTSPGAGNVIAGYGLTFQATMTPIAGFANAVTLTCATTAPGSTCVLRGSTFTPTTPTTTAVTLTTTAKYQVIGYGGVGGGWMWMIALLSGGALWLRRKSSGQMVRVALMMVMVAFGMLGMTGCSGKLPEVNAGYTAPGDYTFTVTATDGFLVRSASYNLHVTAQ